MKVDKVIELLVREALAASVAEEPDRFYQAIGNLGNDDESVAAALSFAFAVDAGALLAIHDGQLALSPERLLYLAAQFATT